MDRWSMTIENSVNAIIFLRVVTGEQPSQARTFLRGVNQKFMPSRKDKFFVPTFNEPAQIEAVEWSVFPRHYLMPLMKASIWVLKFGETEVKSLLEAGWEENDKFNGDLKCSGQ